MLVMMTSGSGTTAFKINSLRNEVSYGMSPVAGRGAEAETPVLGLGRCEDSCALVAPPGCGTWRQVLTSNLPPSSRKPSALREGCTAFPRWRRIRATATLPGAAVRCSLALRGAQRHLEEVRVGACANSVASTKEASVGSECNQCAPWPCLEEWI